MDPFYWLGIACVLYTAVELRSIYRRVAERRARVFLQHARRFSSARPVPPCPDAPGFSARNPVSGEVIPVVALRI